METRDIIEDNTLMLTEGDRNSTTNRLGLQNIKTEPVDWSDAYGECTYTPTSHVNIKTEPGEVSYSELFPFIQAIKTEPDPFPACPNTQQFDGVVIKREPVEATEHNKPFLTRCREEIQRQLWQESANSVSILIPDFQVTGIYLNRVAPDIVGLTEAVPVPERHNDGGCMDVDEDSDSDITDWETVRHHINGGLVTDVDCCDDNEAEDIEPQTPTKRKPTELDGVCCGDTDAGVDGTETELLLFGSGEKKDSNKCDKLKSDSETNCAEAVDSDADGAYSDMDSCHYDNESCGGDSEPENLHAPGATKSPIYRHFDISDDSYKTSAYQPVVILERLPPMPSDDVEASTVAMVTDDDESRNHLTEKDNITCALENESQEIYQSVSSPNTNKTVDSAADPTQSRLPSLLKDESSEAAVTILENNSHSVTGTDSENSVTTTTEKSSSNPVTEMLMVESNGTGKKRRRASVAAEMKLKYNKWVESGKVVMGKNAAKIPKVKKVANVYKKYCKDESNQNIKKSGEQPQRGKVTCQVCKRNFMSRKNLQSHIITHAKKPPYTCKICLKIFRKYSPLKNHYIIHTYGDDECSLICPNCKEGFPTQLLFSNHVKECNRYKDVQMYACNVCSSTFSKLSELKKHAESHKGKQMHPCEGCQQKFSNIRRLKMHSCKPRDGKGFTCDVCNKTFSYKSELQSHRVAHTGEKPFSCQFCSKRFSYASGLYNHIHISHKDSKVNKTYSCEVCNKTFPYLSLLKIHSVAHTGAKPYKCKLCSRSFKYMSGLTNHTIEHTDQKPLFACKVCDKTFTFASKLEIHTATHTGKKSFKCKTCPKAFRYASGLRSHVCNKTREKSYACRVCNKTYPVLSHLKSHIKVHWKKEQISSNSTAHSSNFEQQNKNLYKCKVCSEKFFEMGVLINHMVIHADCEEYQCDICGSCVQTLSYFLEHLQCHSKESSNSITSVTVESDSSNKVRTEDTSIAGCKSIELSANLRTGTCNAELENTTAELSENVTTGTLSENVTAADFSENVTTAELSENVTIAELSENVTNAELSENVTAAELSENLTTAELSENATTAELSENATTTELSENVTIAELSENVTTAELSENVTTAELSENVTTAELSENANTSISMELFENATLSFAQVEKTNPCNAQTENAAMLLTHSDTAGSNISLTENTTSIAQTGNFTSSFAQFESSNTPPENPTVTEGLMENAITSTYTPLSEHGATCIALSENTTTIIALSENIATCTAVSGNSFTSFKMSANVTTTADTLKFQPVLDSGKVTANLESEHTCASTAEANSCTI